ncbi:ubiquinone biosynthesis [Chlorella sorokiniana]|uniref:Ubiquinone biosynthesis n=1 Tax=Chlorella sorokiniana TaxID=3076 RepID=A0A2P6TL48_CHLSO|nr:ubiquinone biosynthesis [Chlorella sorokiniana]|eukprot:PRW45022.1 ubiquinone biosynthesis [Chlorella sorokiniana]
MSPTEAAVQEAVLPAGDGGSAGACEALQSQADDSVAIFQQNWQVYQKMLAVDFLYHKTLYRAAQEVLLSHWGSGSTPASTQQQPPLAMLDLGCGDAQQVAAMLARCGAPSGALRLASYTGVDMSPPALAIAQQNLTFLQPACAVSLLQHDMTTFVEACPPGQYDLVFASFAVHHLSLEGKARFLAHAARCLRPGGAFVLVDIFLRQGEERGPFVARFRAYMQEAVDAGIIDADEAATVMGHIEPFDFPETVPTYQHMAAEAGFAAADCLHTDPREFSRLMVLRTAAEQ